MRQTDTEETHQMEELKGEVKGKNERREESVIN